ncbi:MAG TPA: lysine--tRNA ligase, partial [Candidatus Acetothermia bacterium]|nr:lysine--tRNA ligase [Candidatus Acetothermia bacterium]
MAEAELIASRREKLARLRAQGIDPYPHQFQRTHTAAALRAAYSDLPPQSRTGLEARVAGRLMARRVLGRIAFAVLQDQTD